MSTPFGPPIFDGHNDILSMLYQSSAYPDISAFGDSMPGHIDLQKARAGGFAGGFFCNLGSVAD
jgi:membrane dipeptidase